MPRGGKHAADDFSPYKHPDGRILRLDKSSRSRTGYYRVVKVKNLFYSKLKLDEVSGSRSQKLFGKGKKTAREAAIILADYLDTRYELPTAPPRAPHGSQLSEQQRQEKKDKRLEELMRPIEAELKAKQSEHEAAIAKQKEDEKIAI